MHNWIQENMIQLPIIGIDLGCYKSHGREKLDFSSKAPGENFRESSTNIQDADQIQTSRKCSEQRLEFGSYACWCSSLWNECSS